MSHLIPKSFRRTAFGLQDQGDDVTSYVASQEELTRLSGIFEMPLAPSALEEMVTTPSAGATVTFSGIVRDHDPDAESRVTRLDYTAHPAASQILKCIVGEANREFTHPRDRQAHPIRVLARHRIGELTVGDSALVVVVAAAHREEAFTTCSNVVEQIKTHVPIWKKQYTHTGDYHWVGSV